MPGLWVTMRRIPSIRTIDQGAVHDEGAVMVASFKGS